VKYRAAIDPGIKNERPGMRERLRLGRRLPHLKLNERSYENASERRMGMHASAPLGSNPHSAQADS